MSELILESGGAPVGPGGELVLEPPTGAIYDSAAIDLAQAGGIASFVYVSFFPVELADFADLLDSELMALVVEAFGVNSVLTSIGSYHIYNHEGIGLRDVMGPLFLLALVDGTTVLGSSDAGLTINAVLADLASLLASPSPSNHAISAIVDLFRSLDSHAFAFVGELIELITSTDLDFATVASSQSFIESLQLAEQLGMLLEVPGYAADSLSITTAHDSSLVGYMSLFDKACFGTWFALGANLFQGWSVNTESKAGSRYSNFNFTSLARVGDAFYASAPDGLYLLDGQDDDGTFIDALILTGKFDFDSAYFKHVREAFIGYSSDKPIVLKTISSQDGVETVRYYTLSEHWTGADREARVKLGRGVKSRYWQFEIRNFEGGQMELDRLDFEAIRLSRRI